MCLLIAPRLPPFVNDRHCLPWGLCSTALWMSRFVLPHGGPQPLLFRSLFSCLQRFNETCDGTLSKPLDMTCVVISESLWIPTYQDFPWSLYNSGAAHYDGRPPWWSPLFRVPLSCPCQCLPPPAGTFTTPAHCNSRTLGDLYPSPLEHGSLQSEGRR